MKAGALLAALEKAGVVKKRKTEADRYRTALRGILRISTDPDVRERARRALSGKS